MILNAVFKRIADIGESESDLYISPARSAGGAGVSSAVGRRRNSSHPSFEIDSSDDFLFERDGSSRKLTRQPPTRTSTTKVSPETADYFIGGAGNPFNAPKTLSLADSLFRMSQYKERLKHKPVQNVVVTTKKQETDGPTGKKSENVRKAKPPITLPRMAYIPGPVRSERMYDENGNDIEKIKDFKSRWSALRKSRRW